MTVEIRAACAPGEVRVAALRDGVLTDYMIWRPGHPDGVGDLHRGRVTAVVPAMAGAFVAIAGAEGFLPDSAGAAGRGVGDVLSVRVSRAAQGGKGPRLAAVAEGEGPAPALLARGPGAVEVLAARYPEAAVRVDSPALAALLRLGGRVAVVARAFDAALENEVAALAEPEVALPGGGMLHVAATRALTAIDVDAGGRSGERAGKAASQAALNRDMLPELARQIRLRNLSGAILVDFAGLSPRRRAALGPDLAAALRDDALRPRLLGFTALGLAEIVRARVHPPLHELLAGPHAAGLAALRRFAAEVAAAPGRRMRLRLAPAVHAALMADAVARAEAEAAAGAAVALLADPGLGAVGWAVEDAPR